jgi:hypothetical protein
VTHDTADVRQDTRDLRDENRFCAMVEVAPTGCWLWKGYLDKGGYGHFSCRQLKSRSTSAHRWSYQYFHGDIPAGLQVDHLCRVRNCVNPLHLEAVTQKENCLRGTGFSAKNATKTHCPKGHPYDAANVRLRMTKKGPARHCRKCGSLARTRLKRRRRLERLERARMSQQRIAAIREGYAALSGRWYTGQEELREWFEFMLNAVEALPSTPAKEGEA